MADYYPATARILDARLPYETGLRIVEALVNSGLLYDDHEPVEFLEEWDTDRGPVMQICDPQATYGLEQLLDSDLAQALRDAHVPFMLFSDPGAEGYTGRCLDWQPDWPEPRWRDWDASGPLMSATAWSDLRARCNGDGTRLRRELDAFFTEVFDNPTFEDPADERCDAHGVTALVTRSAGSDGAPVVFVDTDEDLEGGMHSRGPRMRILLNDHPVHVGIDWEPAVEDDDEPLAA